MAGGKETPRQKMIGMMYLVLTALLALNVSKEIIAAFVTINDKLAMSGELLQNNTLDTYNEFEKKRLAIKTQGGDLAIINLWQGKSDQLSKRTRQVIGFILSESNEMIKMAEGGQDWVADRDEDGNIKELRSLFDINAMDNYDIPTNRFIGGNPMQPKQEGLALRDSVLKFRDYVTELMGTYTVGDRKFEFKAPENEEDLKAALATANPDDTVRIAQIYHALSLPEMLEVRDAGRSVQRPWPSVMFDHAPIVAAAAMLTALKVDILNAESVAADFMLSKIDAPSFNFNKIEPMPFARSSYINPGDSLNLRVMIAAYDSTDIPEIRFGINADTIPEKWTTTTGSIPLKGTSSGDFIVKGQIGVREKGQLTWKDWRFRYTVGSPSGAVSLPELNVLYRGYPNKLTAAASGYPSFRVTGGGNVDIRQQGQEYIASPGSGREATVNLVGVAEDGSTANLGSFKFRVQNMPKPDLRWGAFWDGDSAPMASLGSSNRIGAMYPPAIPLEATFTIVDWEIQIPGARLIAGRGSQLSEEAMRLIRQAPRGSLITIATSYRGPDGKTLRKNGSFKVQ